MLIIRIFHKTQQDTLLTSWTVYWTLQRVSPLAHTSSTMACHICCTRNCTGSTSQNVSTTNWESQCIAICSTRLLSTWSTAVHQSQTFPADVIYGQSATRHHLTVPRYWLSTFGRRAFSVADPTVRNSLPDSRRNRRSATTVSDNRWRRNRYHSAHTAQ